MTSPLVNVRLDQQRIERTRKLRAKGITLSDLVRDAIDRQFEQLVQSTKRRDATAIMRDIYERYPDSSHLEERSYDVHDRTEAASAIVRRLRRKK